MEEIQNVVNAMEEIMEDVSVPRNIRKQVADAKDVLLRDGDPVVRISEAIYLLDEASNDINMPVHTRIQVWQIISTLESIKERMK